MTAHVVDEVSARSSRRRRTEGPRETRAPHAAARQKEHNANVDQVLDDAFPASDPPSWTTAISRVAVAITSEHQINERFFRRVRAEYLEMPGLCLTLSQAQRLWSLDPRTCEAVLNSLIDTGFLRRTGRGLFVLCRPGG
jgi:hypothetical protein